MPSHFITPLAAAAPARRTAAVAALLSAFIFAVVPAHAADTSAAEQLRQFSAQAGVAASAERGKAFFTTRHGAEWSCASCHGAPPVAASRHASTGKPVEALAPAANPDRFTDAAKVGKWFRRNCKDVLGRDCSAGEKADVMAYLIGLKP